MVAERSVLSCGNRSKWQHKRKSMLMKYFIKRKKLYKNFKPTDSANKGRHVSNESKSYISRLQKKKVSKNFVKTERSVINNSSSNRANLKPNIK